MFAMMQGFCSAITASADPILQRVMMKKHTGNSGIKITYLL
jgi:hypothetical protein